MARIDALTPDDRASRPARRGVRAHVPSAHARVARRRRRRACAGRRRVGATARVLRRGRRRLPALPARAAARRRVPGPALQAAPQAPRRGGGAAGRGSRRRPTTRPASCRCITSRRASSRPHGAMRAIAAKPRRRRVRVRRSGRALLARARGEPARRRHSTRRSWRSCTRRWATRGRARPSSTRRPTPMRPRAGTCRRCRWRRRSCCSSARGSRRSSASIRRRCAGLRARARRCRTRRTHAIARQRARVDAWYATVLQAEGRNEDAIRWAERAIAEAAAVDDPDALGSALFHARAGRSPRSAGTAGRRSSSTRCAAYQRSGDRVKQATILSNARRGQPG